VATSKGRRILRFRLPRWLRSNRRPGAKALPSVKRSFDAREDLLRRLNDATITDSDFDDVYPSPIRRVSASFWTPVSVAARAARLLVRDASTRVLDIGSGAGKFCIVGAAVTGASFTGIEHRGHLVEVARVAA